VISLDIRIFSGIASRYNQYSLSLWSEIIRRVPWLVPRTRMARFTGYVFGLEILLLFLQWIFRKAGATTIAAGLQGWVSFVGLALWVLLLFLVLRWFRNHVMWSVRNRLIVTYLFIGGVPVTLAITLAIGTGILGVEHLATFLAVSEIHAQEQRLSAANAAAAEQVTRRGMTPEQIMATDSVYPQRSIQILPQKQIPGWLKDNFAGLVSDGNQLSLRAANTVSSRQGPAMIISTVPFDQKFLGRIAARLGSLTLTKVRVNTSSGLSITTPEDDPSLGPERFAAFTSGTIPSAQSSFDPELHFGGFIQATEWSSGGQQTRLLGGATRPSAIVSYLGTSMGIWTGVIGLVLLLLTATFGVVMLVALLIGVRLTRTITYSVANLYRATEHINKGDFTHRIKVRQKDQLGALQTAFNSMTESLERLIVEQKEKERLQSELEIAHEVQAQLFPQGIAGTGTLELYGVCRPARIVSGDYYDFLSYNAEQVGLAVGDISGKGISAALLMATIHSAVRAYEQEQLVSAGASAAYGTHTRAALAPLRTARPSPAQMLWLLNRHLYATTQPEKYATLFLGFYDDESRRLTYSNAGHLPPIILGEDGSTRRLDVGGTVVGLFNNCEYQEDTVQLHPGDIFIAFSDGMTEPENEFGEFGEARLVETITSYRDLPLERISEHAIAAVQDWIGSEEQPDDVTLVLARRTN
jgi:sigma-B regulation protein RsbU (phosphoserine phosphatase)